MVERKYLSEIKEGDFVIVKQGNRTLRSIVSKVEVFGDITNTYNITIEDLEKLFGYNQESYSDYNSAEIPKWLDNRISYYGEEESIEYDYKIFRNLRKINRCQ